MTDRPEPVPHPRPRRPLRGRSVRTAAGLVACALLATAWLLPSAAAGPDRVDPAALPQGPAPGVVHLVRDTIRDGDRSIPATVRGRHDALWTVRGGYVLRDYDVGPRRLTRVVFVADTGDRRVLARSRHWVDVEVSPGGGLVAVQRATGPLGERSTVTVEEPATGRVVGRRELRLATLVAVTRSRVLLGLRSRWRDPSTVWWNLESDRTRRLVDQVAVSADVAHDRMVLLRPVGEFCHRVAPLSDPRRTLWRSCRTTPHQWSPDGRHALATWAYFDAAGTDRWWVVDGRTGESRSRIVGRLDWQAVWEDDGHFLVNAQGDRGGAAVVRCDLEGTCERATRLWDTPLPNEPSLYYRSPPVVLAGR